MIDNGSDGLRLDGNTLLTVSDAQINGNHHYAISLDGQQGKVQASLATLELHHNRLAALHTRGEGMFRLKKPACDTTAIAGSIWRATSALASHACSLNYYKPPG